MCDLENKEREAARRKLQKVRHMKVMKKALLPKPMTGTVLFVFFVFLLQHTYTLTHAYFYRARACAFVFFVVVCERACECM